jgi:uncharacterized protein YjbI with pentapeptide repeats
MQTEKELTFEQLRDAYLKGQRTFRDIEIVGADGRPLISGIVLRSAVFFACWFHSVKFIGVDFTGTKFDQCNLKCTVFERCNLSDTVWEDSAVCSTAWRDCATENIQAVGCEAYGASLEDSESIICYAKDNGIKSNGCKVK